MYTLKRSPLRNANRSPWAIKKITKRFNTHTEIKNRLCVEAEILRKLTHPNIIGFRGFLRSESGDDCLAMEECDVSLGDLIESRSEDEEKPFEVQKLLKIGVDIANALSYLHDKALLMHCDIKSYNILIKGDFAICKLCDFGVCMPIDKNGCLDKTKAGKDAIFQGTPAWSPPEVFGESPVITSSADIYAFGLVFFEMIALMPPVTAEENESCSSLETSSELDESVVVSFETKQRPDLPDIDLGEKYNPILEMYFCCTMSDYKKRPKAKLLKLFFEESVKHK